MKTFSDFQTTYFAIPQSDGNEKLASVEQVNFIYGKAPEGSYLHRRDMIEANLTKEDAAEIIKLLTDNYWVGQISLKLDC